jgi:hypothetical protein
MRITVAILGLASTTLWGCKNDVTQENLEKQIANIRTEYEGKLHELEIAGLDRAQELAHAPSSSDRRYLQKRLKHVFGNANKPITKEQIGEILEELGKYKGTQEAHYMGQALLSRFDTSTEEQRARIGASLNAELERKRIFAERRNAIVAKIQAIEAKFPDTQLLEFEKKTMKILSDDRLSSASLKLYNDVLDSIYTENPKYSEATKVEITHMLGKMRTSFHYSLQSVLDNYDELTPAQRKRVKGWFEFINRMIEEEKARGTEV